MNGRIWEIIINGIIIALGDNDVQGHCAKANCGCMKDAFMCGKEVGKYRFESRKLC
jgi:hypothetical protein